MYSLKLFLILNLLGFQMMAFASAPTLLEVKANKDGSLFLSWDSDLLRIKGFIILIDDQIDFSSPLVYKINGKNIRDFTSPILNASTTYWAKIRPMGKNNSLLFSDVLAATTSIQDLSIEQISSDGVELRWNNNSGDPNIIGHTIRYSQDVQFLNQVEYVYAGDRYTSNFQINSLICGENYYFEIKVESNFDSRFSNPVTVNIPCEFMTITGPPISKHYFGINAWMPFQIGQRRYYGNLEELFCGVEYFNSGECDPGIIQAAGVSLVRYGGIGVDENYDPELSPGQYLAMVDMIRANGMEPILQVPFNDGEYSSNIAEELVRYINITNARAVKYWTIGNEPNLKYDNNQDALSISSYFKQFSYQMKNVDPNILITGVDLAWYDSSIIEELMLPGGSADITGSFLSHDGHELYYLDIFNFHAYPFEGDAEQTRQAVIDYPGSSLQDKLIDLKEKVEIANIYHGRHDQSMLKMAITEINVNWRNPANDNVEGVGATSFLGGQFWAEVFGLGLKYQLDFVTPWSVSEGMNLGFLSSDGTPFPSYYHYQMMAQNFNGISLDPQVSNPENFQGLKVFGSIDEDKIALLVLNQNESNDLPISIQFNNEVVQNRDGITLSLNLGLNHTYNSPINAPVSRKSSVLYLFDRAGNLVEQWIYTEADHATLNLPPTIERF